MRKLDEKTHENEDQAWMSWMKRNGHIKEITCYDYVLELAVRSYNLNKKSRKQELKDKVQFTLTWWHINKKCFNKYKSVTKVGQLFNMHHTNIVHHYKHRKKSSVWDKSTECISDFLGENYTGFNVDDLKNYNKK